MAFSGSSYCLAALSVSSVWGCQRKISSVVISGQLLEPGEAMGGAGCSYVAALLPSFVIPKCSFLLEIHPGGHCWPLGCSLWTELH